MSFLSFKAWNFLLISRCRANNAVEGRLAEYPNAFSIAIPGITNVGYLARVQDTADSDTYKKFDRWSTTPEGMFDSDPKRDFNHTFSRTLYMD